MPFRNNKFAGIINPLKEIPTEIRKNNFQFELLFLQLTPYLTVQANSGK